jgi:hypothetical protein
MIYKIYKKKYKKNNPDQKKIFNKWRKVNFKISLNLNNFMFTNFLVFYSKEKYKLLTQ